MQGPGKFAEETFINKWPIINHIVFVTILKIRKSLEVHILRLPFSHNEQMICGKSFFFFFGSLDSRKKLHQSINNKMTIGRFFIQTHDNQ